MMDIGRVGLWTNVFDSQPTARAQEIVAELEELGYPTVWIPESRGRESFVQSALLLAGGKRMIVATGITNLYGRDPMSMANAQRTLAEAFPDRFLLGIGVSHRPTVEGMRGHRYEKPIPTMRAYLDAMDNAPFIAAAPAAPPPRVLAALGPLMLKLSAERSNGSHPYFVPPEHTAEARRIQGPGSGVAPEQAVVLERDPARARAIARAHTVSYLQLENYVNNLRRLGFGEDDLKDAGSDRLVDSIVAWGGLDAIVGRVKAHLDAGADHVCVQVLNSTEPRPAATPGKVGTPPVAVPMREWRELAPALLGL